jgi:orotidine-5'-phosphate decarboxylase
MPLQPHERIIIALDVATVAAARSLVDQLIDEVCTFKIGPHFFLDPDFSSFVTEILASGMTGLFLDFKHFDIDETVRMAVRQAASRGVNFVTVHPHRSTMMVAAEAAKGSSLNVLAVPLLTSFDSDDLFEFFRYEVDAVHTTAEFMVERALLAEACGCHGVICSPEEVAELRKWVGDRTLLVTPGTRPEWASTDDHKRYGTPKQAVLDGADYLVIGRPVIRAESPRDAFRRIADELQ